MSFIEPKENLTKPKFYCPGKYHLYRRGVIPQDQIFECRIKDCCCNHINGWVGVCIICHRVVHNCQWGCPKGIFILSVMKGDMTTTQVKLHGYLRHFNRPMTLGF